MSKGKAFHWSNVIISVNGQEFDADKIETTFTDQEGRALDVVPSGWPRYVVFTYPSDRGPIKNWTPLLAPNDKIIEHGKSVFAKLCMAKLGLRPEGIQLNFRTRKG